MSTDPARTDRPDVDAAAGSAAPASQVLRRRGITAAVTTLVLAGATLAVVLLPGTPPTPATSSVSAAPVEAPSPERAPAADLETDPAPLPELDERDVAPVAAPDPAPAEDPQPVAAVPEASPTTSSDPCVAHQNRDGEVFIEVAGPLDGQPVAGSFELVGCSNVYEATVRFRVVDQDGTPVVDSFTTAACGSGCVGEFRETVDVPEGSGPLQLEVFYDDVSDGTEAGKATVTLQRS